MLAYNILYNILLEYLKVGDCILKLHSLDHTSTIGVISPAFFQDKNIIDKKMLEFKELGFNLKIGKFIYNKFGYLAGSDKDRALDIMNMFTNKDIDAIVCFRGGYGCMRIIPYLDFELIKQNPKPFCGYSDITILLNLLNKKCSFPTFHSPMINSDFTDSITKEYFLNILTNYRRNYIYDLNIIGNAKIQILNEKDFNGKLIGGNLSMICSTLGTPYEIDFTDSILLIEEINEEPYVIDRLLTQLIMSNKLKYCNGIILGHFTNCTTLNPNSFKIDEIIHQKLIPLNIPLITGFPAGHSYPNITLPIGANLHYAYKSNILKVCSDIFY